MITWTKTMSGEWAARGEWQEFMVGRHVIVTSKDGRETLCLITGDIPALIPGMVDREPTEADYRRIIIVSVERETRSTSELMREVREGF